MIKKLWYKIKWADWGEVFKGVFLICGVSIGFTALIISIYGINVTVCTDTATMMGYHSHFGLGTGCMIEVEPSKWIPLRDFVYVGK